MRPQPPEFYQAILLEKTAKQIDALPDEVCNVIAYSLGWSMSMVVDMPKAVRAFLHDHNTEMNGE